MTIASVVHAARLERRQSVCGSARPRIARQHRRRRSAARAGGRPRRTAGCSARRWCRQCRPSRRRAPRRRRPRARLPCRAAPAALPIRAPRAADGRSLRTPTAARTPAPAHTARPARASVTYGRIDTRGAIPAAAAIAGRSSCGCVRLSPTISRRAAGWLFAIGLNARMRSGTCRRLNTEPTNRTSGSSRAPLRRREHLAVQHAASSETTPG